MLRSVRRRVLSSVGVIAVAGAVLTGMTARAAAADPTGPSWTNPRLVTITPSAVVGVDTISTFTSTVENRNLTDHDDFEFTFPAASRPGVTRITDVTSGAVDGSDCFFQPSNDPAFYQAECAALPARIGDKLQFDFGIFSSQPGVYTWSESTCVGCPGESGFSTDTVGSGVWTVIPAQPVAQSSASLTPTYAAGASEVTYNVGFTTSGRGALATGRIGNTNPYVIDGSVSLTFPVGTFFNDFAAQPPAGPQGAWTWHPCVEDTYTVVCTLATGAVPAHTHLVIPVTGMVNPGAGSRSITVSTTTDTVAVKTPKYTTVAAHPVSSPSLALTPSNAAGANTGLTVDVTTSTTGGLGPDSLIRIDVPGTEDEPSVTGTVTDRGASVGGCGGATPNLSCGLSRAVPAGDTLTIALSNVFYDSVGSYPVTISTTSDITPVTIDAHVNTARPVTGLVVNNLSDTPYGRTDYQVAFTTSSQGGMSGPTGAVRVDFPAGTVFGYGQLVATGSLVDLSQRGETVSSCSFDQTGLEMSCANFVHPVAAGDHLVAHANGLTNPGAGVYELSVTTSSDSAIATSLQYLITGSVDGVTVAVTPSAVAGGRSHYLVRFGTSFTGELNGDANDFVLLAFPYGTGLGGDFSDSTLTSLNGTVLGTCQEFASPYVICGIAPGIDDDGGDYLSVDLSGVVNPPAGNYTVGVSTSEDQDVVTSPNYTIGAPAAVTGVTAALGPATAAGARSDYAVTLTTSATGVLSPSAHSVVTVQFPAGTGLAALASATVTEAGSPVGTCPSTADTLLTCTLTSDVPASTQLTVLADGVVNPPAGAHTVGVQTSSDPGAVVTAAFSTSVPAGVSNPTVTVTNKAKHGARGTYVFAFEPSDGGAMEPGQGASISVTLPAGTYPNQVTSAKIVDGGLSVGGPCSVSGLTISCSITGEVSPDDLVTMTIKSIINPPAGSYTATIWTTSDPVPEISAAYTIK